MGAWPNRITADEFVTPPELQAWRLATPPAGRIGGVRIRLAVEAGRTCLAEVYQQVPLRVLPPFHFGEPPVALVYLLNPTAGLLDGDAHLIQLHAGAGTRTIVVGQSATRIHPAVHGFCTQQFRIHVERGALLVVLPGPAIPFAGCRYYQHVDATLDEDANLVWGDLWQAGRHSRGQHSERFRFECLTQLMEVRRGNRLIYRDRLVWRGPWSPAEVAWHFGDHLAWANLFATGRSPTDSALSLGAGAAFLPTFNEDTCVRWLGDPQLLIKRLVAAALAAADRTAGTRQGLLETLTNGNLAPNHWFYFQ